MPALALVGLLGRVSASARERGSPGGSWGGRARGLAGGGAAGRARPRNAGVPGARGAGARERLQTGRTRARPELGAAPRNFTPAVGAVALGTLSAAVGAAVSWMRGL